MESCCHDIYWHPSYSVEYQLKRRLIISGSPFSHSILAQNKIVMRCFATFFPGQLSPATTCWKWTLFRVQFLKLFTTHTFRFLRLLYLLIIADLLQIASLRFLKLHVLWLGLLSQRSANASSEPKKSNYKPCDLRVTRSWITSIFIQYLQQGIS